jgi:hypothetical protein
MAEQDLPRKAAAAPLQVQRGPLVNHLSELARVLLANMLREIANSPGVQLNPAPAPVIKLMRPPALFARAIDGSSFAGASFHLNFILLRPLTQYSNPLRLQGYESGRSYVWATNRTAGHDAIKPLPMEFRRSNPVTYESVIFAMCTAAFGWLAWMAFQQGQRVASAFTLCFAAAHLCCEVSLRHKRFTRRVSGVEIGEVANSRSGAKFSLVILQIVGGKQLKITSKYGNIPEGYLTLRAWLARP